jgi:tetratricopeptide (TPR) repeat protein
MAPSFIIFGYDFLAKALGLMQDSQGSLLDCEEWIRSRAGGDPAEARRQYTDCFNQGLRLANEENNPAEAAQLFARCRAIRPNDVEVVFALGQTLLKAGEVEKAVHCFRNAVILSPQSSLVWFNLGLGLSMLKGKQEGLEASETSLELAESDEDKALILKTIKSIKEKLE